ncbi:MAG: long-chain fatty acid--CoA ligase [Oligoflexales bacterium]|nr:long-chain fatty acid--CoA ligase [Oligoflexales bacterium]
MVKYCNLVEMQEAVCRKYSGLPLYGTKKGSKYEWISYSEFAVKVDLIRSGLSILGVNAFDRVAIISKNSTEWAIAAYATYGLNAQFIPMYEKQQVKECLEILTDSSAKVLFVADMEIYSRIVPILEELPYLANVIIIEADESDPRSFDNLLKLGSTSKVPSLHPKENDIMTLIYTSGTTGVPKGVMLTHRNLLANILPISEAYSLNSRYRGLSILPWAHIFGQMIEVHLTLLCGMSIGFAESAEKLLENLKEVSPIFLVAVPRVFIKIYDVINRKMAEKGGIIEALFKKGLALAEKRRNSNLGLIENLVFNLADFIIFRKIRALFGGRMELTISGAAALDPKICQFVNDIGIKVYEGYGLTETAPVVACNYPGTTRIGSIGKTIDGVRVKIDKSIAGLNEREGELIVYGPIVMAGYNNKPEDTAAVFTSDGGFKTGDLGYVDEDGFIYITGRIKEQYKLANGKYVAPAQLEERMKMNQYIDNVMIFGAGQKYNACLISVNLPELVIWALKKGINCREEVLLDHPEVRQLFQEVVDKFNMEVKGYEKIEKFTLTSLNWNPENDLLTQTLKLKRRNVVSKYSFEIENMIYIS